MSAAPIKDHKSENFPVASWLIAARHRPLVLAFYRFARTADDIADRPWASKQVLPEQKELSPNHTVIPPNAETHLLMLPEIGRAFGREAVRHGAGLRRTAGMRKRPTRDGDVVDERDRTDIHRCFGAPGRSARTPMDATG